VILACYIDLLVAPIAPFATIVWSVLTTIALGWANALDCATIVTSLCLFLQQLFFASTSLPFQLCTSRF